MSRIGRRRLKASDDVDVDMVPIMNMFLVLIPFLLMSASFFQMKAINTSVPVQAENTSAGSSAEKAPKDIKVTVIVQIGREGFDISAISDYLEYEDLSKLEAKIGKVNKDEYPLAQMAAYLQKIKEIYPSSDTIIIIPDGSVVYETIIEAMDMARYSGRGDTPLFPNVVLSGKVG